MTKTLKAGMAITRRNRFAEEIQVGNTALIRPVPAAVPTVEALRPARQSRLSTLIQRVDALKRAADAERRNRLPHHSMPLQVPVTDHSACPICDSKTILRSHRRNALEMKLTPFMLPYRCDECGARFYLTRVLPETRSR